MPSRLPRPATGVVAHHDAEPRALSPNVGKDSVGEVVGTVHIEAKGAESSAELWERVGYPGLEGLFLGMKPGTLVKDAP